MTTTSDNITTWKSLSNIDYFTQYIKSYLAFNAWMRTRYVEIQQDRKIINEIKKERNEFKQRIVELLSSRNNEGEMFRSYVGALHNALSSVNIFNRGERISFYNVFIDINTENEKEQLRYGLNYKVKLLEGGRVNVSIHNVSSGAARFSFSHNKYDLSELEDYPEYQRLTHNQKAELRTLYLACNPRRTESIVSSTASGFQVGQYYFIDDIEKITKAIIEILYSLRNTLFHGEILPDNGANNVYEQAYNIMKNVIVVL